MVTRYSATPERRQYTRWVANETMEDFALRFTARRARRWPNRRVANTAIGSISFLALEAIGGALTLTYGFDIAIVAIMTVGAILFLTALPISYYAARYGVDIDLLTRGAGFGYIGSTITSLIYASFTFIFFALEAAILAFALEFCFGIPLVVGYIISSLVVIPLVLHGFSKISAFQTWTQPIWVILHLLPFVFLAVVGYDIAQWTSFEGSSAEQGASKLLMTGAAMGVIFSLIAQVGEQVDFLRFLPEPKTRAERRGWWTALIVAGPGWSILGVVKMIAGSYLVVLALGAGFPESVAGDPTRMYYAAFDKVLASPALVLGLTGAFVILSQLKINVTNAYAGSIAWSNFFSRLTHTHPGRVVWLVFNVAIALTLMELGVFHGLEAILGLYSHVAVAWIGALVSDLVINKPLGLSPRGIEFRRAHLYDINPVGIGAMGIACILSITAHWGAFGPLPQAYSSLLALVVAFLTAPLIAVATRSRYYIARPAETPPGPVETCSLCDYSFDREDMTHCPFHAGPICSLCCTLDSNCRDFCKPHARFDAVLARAFTTYLPEPVAEALMSRLSRFFFATGILAAIVAGLLLIIASYRLTPDFNAVLTIIFGTVLIVIGVSVWMFILSTEGLRAARTEAEEQSERLLREIRAHERTDRALQAAKEKAEAANQAKTRYMTGLSHELRTPLNAIYGFAQILEKDPDIPPARRNSVTTIRRSSEHLAGLIEGLLDISRIESGRLEIMRDRINLRIFLAQVSAIFEESAREKGIALEVETRGRLPRWIASDEKRLRQIFINLLGNAIRYTDTGSVTLRLTYRNEVAVIEVRDTGIGIPEVERDRIWLPFQRGGNASQPGSGLGLTITKLLVEILGGEIEMESTPGAGSVFRVRMMLPSIASSTVGLQAPDAQSATTEIVGFVGPRKTVMVVDDDLNHLTLVSHILEPVGFAVLTASDAAQALEMLDDITPDIFLLDIDMPGRDGWSLAEELRGGRFRTTPIVMISGHALDGPSPGPRTPLCDAFIAKPFTLEDLVGRVAELLKLDLVLKGDAGEDAETETTTEIPTALAEDLIALARIGHASRIEALLDRLEQDLRPEGTLMRRLRTQSREFDMAGLIRTLQEICRDAA